MWLTRIITSSKMFHWMVCNNCCCHCCHYRLSWSLSSSSLSSLMTTHILTHPRNCQSYCRSLRSGTGVWMTTSGIDNCHIQAKCWPIFLSFYRQSLVMHKQSSRHCIEKKTKIGLQVACLCLAIAIIIMTIIKVVGTVMSWLLYCYC